MIDGLRPCARNASGQRPSGGREDRIARCGDAKLPAAKFSLARGFVLTLSRGRERAFEALTPEVTPEVRSGRAPSTPRTRRQLQEELGLRDDDHVRTAYLAPALEAGLIEMTIPDKPQRGLQKYRLTDKGRGLLWPLSKNGRSR